LYFFDAGRRITCTHYFIKEKDKTPRKEIVKEKDKTPRKEIGKAKKHRDNYFRAKKENTISFKD